LIFPISITFPLDSGRGLKPVSPSKNSFCQSTFFTLLLAGLVGWSLAYGEASLGRGGDGRRFGRAEFAAAGRLALSGLQDSQTGARQNACNFFSTRGSVKVEAMDFAMKNIIELTEANFETDVLRAPGPVLVDFYAPWCGPCKMLSPLLKQFAAEYSGKVKFAKVNIDDAAGLADEYEIRSVPTLMVFRGGEPVNQVERSRSA
jgi:thioredoxin 1